MVKNSLRVLMIAGSVLLAAMSLAQGGGRQMMFGGGAGSDTMLLGSPDVQKELKLTETQMKDIKAIQDAQRQEMMDMFQNGGGGGDREEMMKQVQAMMKKSEDKIKAILTADQNKRLKQIGVQTAGGRALFREDIQKELGLSATQRKALMDLQAKNQETMMSMFQQMRDQSMTREEMQAAMEKSNKSMNEEALKVLTAEQKTAFEAMKGPKFEGKIQMGRPGGGGGGN